MNQTYNDNRLRRKNEDLAQLRIKHYLLDVIKGITYPRVGIRLQRSRRKSIYEPGCIWVTKKWLLKVEKLLSAGVHVPVVEESKNDTYAYTIRREKGTLEGEKNTFRCKNVIFSSILPCMQIILSKSTDYFFPTCELGLSSCE